MKYHLMLLIILFLLATVGVFLYRKLALRLCVIDVPNERSSHQVPTPRGAGVVFISLWVLLLLVGYCLDMLSLTYIGIFLPVFLIMFVSMLDDYCSLSAKLRFLIQFLAALISLWILGGVSNWELGFINIQAGVWLSSAFALIFILWSTNVFNFMDGVDGLAGAEAISVLFPLSTWIFLRAGFSFGLLGFSLCALIAGFLVWNWPKAKVFMGDSGSASLGFLLPLFALVAQQQFDISILSFLVLYGLFLFDGTLTLLRRMIARENWTQPHRSHAYQRLHQAGWSHAKIVSGAIVLNLFLTIIATVMEFFPRYSLVGFLLALILLGLTYYRIERLCPMRFMTS